MNDGRSGPPVVQRLCAHADKDGQGPRWLEPGETCGRPRAADLESEGPARLSPVGFETWIRNFYDKMPLH